MAHAEKYTRAAANGVNRHDERTQHDGVKERKNENIYWERTNRNYAFESMAKRNEPLIAEFEEEHPELMKLDFDIATGGTIARIADGAYKPYTAEEYIKDFGSLPDVTMSNRKDLKAVVSWVVTMPEKVTGAEQERFFEETYAFLRSRYCDKVEKAVGMSPVISAVVHLDETTPHMHFKFIPAYYDKKAEKWRVSAKEVLNRRDLQTFHKDLSTHMQRVFGRDIGIQNGRTKGGNQSIEQLKYNSELKNEYNATQTLYKALQDDLAITEGKLLAEEKNLSKTLSALSAVKEEKTAIEDELKMATDSVVDVKKISSRAPITQDEWQAKFKATPRKLGKGYVVDGEELEKACKQLAKQDKQIVLLAAEVDSLRNNKSRLELGYINPLERVKQATERQEMIQAIEAYKNAVRKLPQAYRQAVVREVKAELQHTHTVSRGTPLKNDHGHHL